MQPFRSVDNLNPPDKSEPQVDENQRQMLFNEWVMISSWENQQRFAESYPEVMKVRFKKYGEYSYALALKEQEEINEREAEEKRRQEIHQKPERDAGKNKNQSRDNGHRQL